MIHHGPYYLWDPRNDINVGRALEAEPGMVKVAPNDLTGALDALRLRAIQYGKAKGLEIHCHGKPAVLKLGSENGITRRNVEWFGTQLRSAILQGGLVELLACRVAAQGATDDSNSLTEVDPDNIKGYVPEYHGRIQELYRGKRWKTNYDHLIHSGATNTSWDAGEFDRRTKWIPIPDQDGLEFCLSLANSSGAVVRAALTPQAEEAVDYGYGTESDLRPPVSPIGDWEGPVFDFYPGHSVKFYGMAPFRNSSFGPIRVDLDSPLRLA